MNKKYELNRMISILEHANMNNIDDFINYNLRLCF